MGLDRPSAKVVAHSKAPNGEELITLEIELHRFILPEFNTHRVLSRNFQSSRAVPAKSMIEQVRSNPALPVHWGENQKGMVAEKELKDITAVKQGWIQAAKDAAKYAEALDGLKCHKQVVNRLLEPFMWTKGVVTATKDGFESFFKLRCHKDAQPEIKLLAERMRGVIEDSTPNYLEYGDYHLPYLGIPYNEKGLDTVMGKIKDVTSSGNCTEDGIRESLSQLSTKELLLINDLTLESAIKISTSCTGQVSYRKLDESLMKAIKVYDMLNLPENGVYKEDPPHFSTTEHVAKVVEDYEHDDWMTGNFESSVFWQYRKALEIGKEQQFMENK